MVIPISAFASSPQMMSAEPSPLIDRNACRWLSSPMPATKIREPFLVVEHVIASMERDPWIVALHFL